MTKRAILIKKLHRAYKKKENWDYSEFKGYPEGTFFGYENFAEFKASKLKQFTDYYGKNLKGLRFDSI